ncbi:RICIN domain-containing protein [Streptomyces aureoverticillatus]|uniref:RICIN domain-containing protein n=1 Tax=Streptomyces aureoverticillatus TaxID=66871 RepID=UPI0013DAD11D|nr:RICIN domain-containing protein [Streptomyces aureoverticillatus]QIB44431.1 RICIN domain-containing protein [Streptomyces aureoverticillatus]
MAAQAALSEGIYLIKNEASGLYAGVQPGGGAKQGAKVVLGELHTEGPERHRQFWHLKPHSAREGAWTLQNVHSVLRMDIMAGRGRAGAAVQQCPPESRDDLLVSQLWKPEQIADDVYVWVNSSGKNLAVRGERPEAEAELEQAEPKTAEDRGTQAWRVERVQARGESKAFDALTARVVSPGTFSTPANVLASALKGILDAGGGIFETMAKTVPDPRAPYLRFDGFRGDEFIRFSPRLGIEEGPKKISEQFPQVPTGFPGAADDVMNARKGSGYTHAAIMGSTVHEFSERSANRGVAHLELGPVKDQRIKAATTAETKGEAVAAFLDLQAVLLTPDYEHTGEFRLPHAPAEFLTELDTATSAPFDDAMHFFLVKGEEFVIVSQGKLVQGPTKLTDAYPFLTGVWM